MREGNLEIHVSDESVWRRFDDESTHLLSHCMKAVDFIAHLDNSLCFIEIKDPENPFSRKKDSQRFVQRFQAEQIDPDLVYKFRDSFLYEWACDRIPKSPRYYIILAIETLSEGELLGVSERISRKIPLMAPDNLWKRQILETCLVFNMRTWNKHFPQYSIKRTNS